MWDVKNWLRARFCEHGDEQMSSTKREKCVHQLVKKVCPVAAPNPKSMGFCFFFVALRPNVGHGLLILEVSRSRTTTNHSR